ncbi:MULTISPECIES: amino acid permease [unclassified Bartonella]|uniref:amino acid permease n=1 Tax=unclassified Bartonella TaxID=2645622 RepID=UPI0009995AAF|nr:MULTISPECIES: amino acid permease [unclassified Bartonella]AQX22778.1 histidine transporter [Bartonella sp. 11B]AQX23935.1 histidine transporter [Bartonella sp. 114]AQX25228.1 histidine:proton symporter, AAT family [Bartonella sp. Coyote22sub2]
MTTNELKRGINQRQVIFLALGSAIGTGLFYGSAQAINLAGPSVLIAYCIAGLAIFIVMRALGEMIIHNPLSGSFARYATNYISPLAGFLTGWTYVFEVVLVGLADITVFATYMSFWYPDVASWIWTLSITLIITGINLAAVKVYGELEFWLSSVKIIAIFAMIILGIAIIFFNWNTNTFSTIGIHNLWQNGGVFPNGLFGFLACFSVVVFAFGGVEIIGMAAMEVQDPDKTISRAINSIPIRIVLFYVMTLAVLMSLYPWNEIRLISSPFVTIFERFGISSAAHILNIVVITAVVSAINSEMYGAVRMIHGLSQEGYAFKKFQYLSKNGIPIFVILLVFSIFIFGVILNYYYHDQLFFLIATMATFATVFVWVMILLSQIFMRLKMSAEEHRDLKFPIPFWPIGSIFATLFMIFIFILLWFFDNTRSVLMIGVIWLSFLVVCFYALKLYNLKKRKVYQEEKRRFKIKKV